MKVNSHNEWDKLVEIIVGNAESIAPLIFPTEVPVDAEPHVADAACLPRRRDIIQTPTPGTVYPGQHRAKSCLASQESERAVITGNADPRIGVQVCYRDCGVQPDQAAAIRVSQSGRVYVDGYVEIGS